MRATIRNQPLHTLRALTPEQLNAVDLLATGATDAAVGEAVGVCRVTVTRWRTSPTFLAALNRRRADLFAGATDLLRDIVPKALAVIAAALDGDDEERKLSAAFELLKRVDLSAGGCIGPTDHRAIVDEELTRRTAVEGTRHDHLLATMNGEPPVAERFAATFAEMEAAASDAGAIV